MKPVGWKAYYGDGTTRSSSGHEWSSLPGGVLCVIVYYPPPYRKVMSHADYYWRNPDGSFGCSDTNKEWESWKPDNVIPDGAEAIRSCGRIPDDRFERIYNRAHADTEVP